jgi:hypothetical protein
MNVLENSKNASIFFAGSSTECSIMMMDTYAGQLVTPHTMQRVNVNGNVGNAKDGDAVGILHKYMYVFLISSFSPKNTGANRCKWALARYLDTHNSA